MAALALLIRQGTGGKGGEGWWWGGCGATE
jgi:hypothetical protein